MVDRELEETILWLFCFVCESKHLDELWEVGMAITARSIVATGGTSRQSIIARFVSVLDIELDIYISICSITVIEGLIRKAAIAFGDAAVRARRISVLQIPVQIDARQ